MFSFWSGLRARLIFFVFIAIIVCLVLVVHNGVILWKAACLDAKARALQVATGASRQYLALLTSAHRMLTGISDDVVKESDPSVFPSLLHKWASIGKFLSCADMGVADALGGVVCSLDKSSNSRRTLSQPTLCQNRTNSGLCIGHLRGVSTDGKGPVDIAYPVPDESGKQKWFVFATLDASWFSDLTSRLSIPDGMIIAMVDATGTVMNCNIDPDKWIGKTSADAEIVKTVLRERTGTVEATDIDGVMRLYGFVPVDGEPAGGYVFAGIPKDRMVATAKRILTSNLVWLGLAGMLGIVTVQLLAGTPMRRLGMLLSATRRIAAADLSIRTGLRHSDGELGQLGSLFDQMAEALESRDREQRNEDQRLCEEKDLLSSLIDSLPGAFFLIDSDMGMVRWNQQLRVMSGFSDSEIPQMQAIDFVAKRDRDKARDALLRAFADGEQSLDASLLTKDGVHIPCWFTGARTFLKGAPYVVSICIDVTKLKSVETTLMETRRTLRTILDAVPVGISLFENKRISWANRAWGQILGWTEGEECVGREARTLHASDEEYRRAESKLHQCLHREMVAEIDTTVKRRDNKLIAANLRLKSVSPEGPGDDTVIAVLSDISQRKRAENALRESERRFRELVSGTDLCSFIADADGNVLFCNDALLQLTGWQQSEVIGNNCISLFCAPDCREAMHTRLEEALRAGETPFHTEVPLITRNGLERLTKWTIALLRDEEGHVLGSAGIGEDITQQREAEEALRVSKETLEGVFHAITESIFLCDAQALIITANETAAQRLGKTVEELVGRCVYDLFPADVAEKRRDYSQGICRTRSRVRAQDSRGELFFDISLYPIFGSNGKVTRVAAFGRDMTEQRQAEQALLVEKQKFQSLCDYAPFGMVMVAADGTIRYVNQSFSETFGYNLADIPHADTWFDLAYPDESYRTWVLSEWLNDITGGRLNTDRSKTFTVRCKDGTDKIARFIIADLNASEYLLTVQDITEQQLSEQRVRESEERFRAIFESATDCIFIKDRHGIYTHVNPAMQRLFGLQAHNIIGTTDDSLFGSEAATRIRKLESRVLKGASVELEETRVINGLPLTFSIINVPLYDSRGRIAGLCGIARDITDRKHAGETKPVEAEIDARAANTHYPSLAMRTALTMAQVAASTDSTVLLLGESGSGKDYLGQYIHERSLRATGPYFVVNCATVAPDVADSELFGHEAGAFTGAIKRKLGLLELAEGGTLLLNEVGELPLPLQAKLLTFLDTSQFTRVGGEHSIMVNARILAATNRDLERDVAEGIFRKDLYYRLNVFAITVPPLRERLGDLPILVSNIMSELALRLQLHEPPPLGPGVMDALASYHWPGNVRELRNVLERAIILSGGAPITVRSVPLQIASDTWSLRLDFPKGRSLNDITAQVRRSFLIEALRRTDGNRTKAARLLGISRHSVINYVKEFNITVDDFYTT